MGGVADDRCDGVVMTKPEMPETTQNPALLAELCAEHARLIEENRKIAAADLQVRLAEQRQEHTEVLRALGDKHQAALDGLRDQLVQAHRQSEVHLRLIAEATVESDRLAVRVKKMDRQLTRVMRERDDAEGRALQANWEIERLAQVQEDNG